MSSKKTFVCPVCGVELKSGAAACYNCGSDDKTGWSEDTYLDGCDIPCDDDEYEELRKKEFNQPRKKPISWVAITGFVLIVIFVLLTVRPGGF